MLNLLGRLFNLSQHSDRAAQTELDRYIANKNPTTISEVNYWVKQYDLTQGRRHGLFN
jgi:hypothetical protein